MVILYKCVVILTGVFLLLLDLRDIVKKRMDIAIGSWWAVMSLIVIVFGLVFDFSSLRSFIRLRNLVLIYLFSLALVTALYVYALSLTRLKKECAELVMWVSYARSMNERPDEGTEDRESCDGTEPSREGMLWGQNRSCS